MQGREGQELGRRKQQVVGGGLRASLQSECDADDPFLSWHSAS